MKDSLPHRPWINESGIVNLDDSTGSGTHWVAYRKRGPIVEYFDSYGNLRPPKELVNFFRGSKINYNYERRQKFNSVNCGHLCLDFIYKKQ